MNPGDNYKVNIFENWRKLSQPLDVVQSGQESDASDVRNLENPTCEESEHADGVHVVPLLNDRRLKNVDRNSVVVISDVAKENDVARHFGYREE